MMGRIVGRHPDVHTFKELHFFDELSTRADRETTLRPVEARRLLCRLFTIQRDGYLYQGDPRRFQGEAEDVLGGDGPGNARPTELFMRFLAYETRRHGATIACDQTPRYVFHLAEIHRELPHARVVRMVRDPRAVLLSQKKKWKRRFLGGNGIPIREAVRVWINYHPVMTSQLWRRSVTSADAVAGESWIHTVRFEDLVADPEGEIRKLCGFLCLDYSPDLLAIPQVGSSNAPDRPDRRGIDPNRVGTWREGGLTDTEIGICQWVTADAGRRHGYDPIAVEWSPLGLAAATASLPLKVAGAFIANLGRFRNLWPTIRRSLK